MKLKALSLAIILLGSSTFSFAGNCIDELSSTISKFSNVEKVNLNPFLLTILKPFSSKLNGFKSINVIDAENLSVANYKQVKNILDQCNSTDYETVVSKNNGDEITRVWIKLKEQYINEIVVIALESDEVSVVHIKGEIEPKHLQNIIEENN